MHQQRFALTTQLSFNSAGSIIGFFNLNYRFYPGICKMWSLLLFASSWIRLEWLPALSLKQRNVLGGETGRSNRSEHRLFCSSDWLALATAHQSDTADENWFAAVKPSHTESCQPGLRVEKGSWIGRLSWGSLEIHQDGTKSAKLLV